MPLYDQSCPHCGHVFEVLRRHDDKTPVPCEKCGAKTERLLSVANFRVHGFNSGNGYSQGGKR